MSGCNSTEITLADLFLEDRLERGLTQTQAAKELGISRGHYCKLENGRAKNPRFNVFGPLLRRKAKLVAMPCSNNDPHRHLTRLASPAERQEP